MNQLVELVRKTLFGKSGVGIRLPAWLGILLGYSFDLAALIMNRRLIVSVIRIQKFMATTSFDSSIDTTSFRPGITLDEGLQRTLIYEFLEDNSRKRTFFSE